MIILSGVLVVVAIALLVTGIVTGNTGHEVAGLDGLKLIYVSIGVSIISALCLAIGVFVRRKELFGSAESATTKRSAASRSGKAARPAKTKARVGAGDDAPTVPAPSATALDVPAETSVFVIPGRKRYHLETCRQLAGRDKEELTFVEAREEGFTACTACLPDTALAARAALTETETAVEAETRSTESPESAADTADLRRPDEDPAQVTRTDLPVTRLETDTADTDIAEVEPAVESPAAAELHEVPEPSGSTETHEATGTSRFDEADEPDATVEAAPEPAEERPSARSRSFFEPLERPGTSPAEAEDAAETDATAADTAKAEESEEAAVTSPAPPEPEPESAVAEDLHEPEPAPEEPATEEPATEEPEDLHPSEAESDEDEPEAAEQPAAEPAAEPDHETPEPATAETDTEPATAEEEADEPADESAADRPDLPFVRILSGTKRYHRPDCALIEDIADDADDLETLSPAEAKDRGCTPCLVCQPDKDPSDDTF